MSTANGTSDDSSAPTGSVPLESIWRFEPDGSGTGNWTEALGPTSSTTLPPDFINPAGGASGYDGGHGYHIGGFASSLSTRTFHDLPFDTLRQEPGLLTFDFETLSLSNTTDGGYFASQYHESNLVFDPGKMIVVPSFGADGIIILLGGSGSASTGHQFEPGVGVFNNITIYDIRTQAWLWQNATSVTGSPPLPRGFFCAVGVQGGDNSTYEM